MNTMKAVKAVSPMEWGLGDGETISLADTGAGAPATALADLGFEDARFRVTHEVARGGMGRILAAIDRLLGRPVALKIAIANTPASRDRLCREAALLSTLDHPSLLPVYELGRLRDGVPYFATRLVDGRTLEQRLGEGSAARWALLPVIAEVADIIDHVHRSGVIHRDLKPSNIILDHSGGVVIVDWGIARRIRPIERVPGAEALHDADLTAPGTAIGTPGYWAPEQRRGEPGDITSDVYSLGAMVFRIVVGRPARSAVPSGAELASAMAGAPSWLLRLVARATEDEPDDRFPSAAALGAELRRGLAGELDAPPPRAHRGCGLSAIARIVAAVAPLAIVLLDGRRADEQVAASTAAALTAPGYWQSDFGDMAFAVSGDQVRAVYDHDQGLFIGRIEDDRVVGHWCEAPYASARDHGDATLVLDPARGRSRIIGTYRYAHDTESAGRWDLDHVVGRAPAPLRARLAHDVWRCGATP